MAVVLWQSVGQVASEVEVADAASVARLVRSCLCVCRCLGDAQLLLSFVVVVVMVMLVNGVIRRVWVLESCELPRYASCYILMCPPRPSASCAHRLVCPLTWRVRTVASTQRCCVYFVPFLSTSLPLHAANTWCHAVHCCFVCRCNVYWPGFEFPGLLQQYGVLVHTRRQHLFAERLIVR